MADSNGMNLDFVGTDFTGRVAISFTATTPPTEAELLAFPPLPSKYNDMGLLTNDGGYSPEVESGDRTALYQAGYSVATGDAKRSFTLTFAEIFNANVRKLTGIDGNVQKKIFHADPVGVIIATRYSNGKSFIRGGMAVVTGVEYNQGTAGEIASVSVTFDWQFSEEYCGYNREVAITSADGACAGGA